MKRLFSLLLFPALLLSVPARDVLIHGNGRLALWSDGEIAWEMPWGGIHDMHRDAQGHIFVQRNMREVCKIDPGTKEVVWSYDATRGNGNEGRPVEVHAFQPLPDGAMMIAESGPARIIEIDRDGGLLHEVPLTLRRAHPHHDTRLARKLESGNYLVCHERDGAVREYAPDGEVVWEFEVPLFNREPKGGHGPDSFGNQVFGALRLESGNTLISTGNGHSVLEVNPEMEIVWKLEQNDLDGITLAWVTTLQVLENGNYVIGNCHAGPGQPILVEVDPATKNVVWQMDEFERFGNDVSNTLVVTP